jgi:hypothetical protein
VWCWNVHTGSVRNEAGLHRVKEKRNILHTIKRRKSSWIGHILRRNCLINHIIEGKVGEGIYVTGRRGRRRKQILDDVKKTTGYWKFKEETLDRTVWRIRFGRGYGPVVRQITEWFSKEYKLWSTILSLQPVFWAQIIMTQCRSLPLVSVRDSPNLCSSAACLLECLHQLLCQVLVYVRFNPMSDYTKHSFRPCRSPF